MARKKRSGPDFAQLQAELKKQFTHLHPNDPSQWPVVPRTLLCCGIALGVAGLLWFVLLSDYRDAWKTEQRREETLRRDFQTKLAKAVNLDALKQQREQVQQYVLQLEKQLPSKAEMAVLLSEINQAGLGRSLQFELFRPGQVVVKDFYAELPITLKVTGNYHDMGAFASDIAHLSRIVTLNNITIAPMARNASSTLTMDATARTFRYLDEQEIQAQKTPVARKKK